MAFGETELKLPYPHSTWENANCAVFSMDITDDPTFSSPFKNFKENPIVQFLDSGYDFKIMEAVEFYFYMDSRQNVYTQRPTEWHSSLYWIAIVVKRNFVTDLVSAPPLLWSIQSPLGPAAKPAVLHDVFYRSQVVIPITQDISFYIDQETADELFLQGLEIRNIPKWRRYPMYWLLRLFGRFNFLKRQNS